MSKEKNKISSIITALLFFLIPDLILLITNIYENIFDLNYFLTIKGFLVIIFMPISIFLLFRFILFFISINFFIELGDDGIICHARNGKKSTLYNDIENIKWGSFLITVYSKANKIHILRQDKSSEFLEDLYKKLIPLSKKRVEEVGKLFPLKVEFGKKEKRIFLILCSVISVFLMTLGVILFTVNNVEGSTLSFIFWGLLVLSYLLNLIISPEYYIFAQDDIKVKYILSKSLKRIDKSNIRSVKLSFLSKAGLILLVGFSQDSIKMSKRIVINQEWVDFSLYDLSDVLKNEYQINN